MGMIDGRQADDARRATMGRRQITVGVGLVVVLAFVASALGAGGLKTRSATVTVASGESDSVVAQCPRGTKPVAGGFEAQSRPEGPDPVPTFNLFKSKGTGARGWTAAASNGGSAAGDLTSFAYCRDLALERRSATVSVGPDEPESATAKCPRGTKALSGGFDADTASGDVPLFRITGSKKKGKRKWTVSATETFGAEGDLTAHVYCGDGKALKAKDASETLPQNTVGELKARCKRGQRVLSGGFEAPDPPGPVAGSLVSASHKVGRRTWTVSAVALNEETVTAYAYCQKTG